MNEQIFKNDSKQVVDSLFEAKAFKENITRDNMNELENLICYMLQSRFDSYQKITKLMEKIEK